MQTISAILEQAFKNAIAEAFSGLDADPIVTISQNEQFGDYQSNAAMSLAKKLAETAGGKSNPRAVAEHIKAKLKLEGVASETSIAGPGFINVRLDPKFISQRLSATIDNDRLAIPLAPSRTKTVVDYSGPNIAKQMHVGHLRSTIIGDAIARVVEFHGDEVIRQNHIGDWGTQFGRVMLGLWYEAASKHLDNTPKLEEWIKEAKAVSDQKPPRPALVVVLAEMQSFHQRAIELDPDGKVFFEAYLANDFPPLERLEQLYTFISTTFDALEAKVLTIRHPQHGEKTFPELARLAALFVQNPGMDRNKQEGIAWQKATKVTMETCREIYLRLGVRLRAEHERGESFYKDFLPDVVRELVEKDVAVESDGAKAVFVDGPEKDPVIIEKTGGGFLYATTDLAGMWFRVKKLGARRIIYTHDARQANHFRQVFAIARKVGWAGDDVQLDYAPFGTMLGEDGKPFKTRSGDTVKLKDLLEEAEKRGYDVAKQKSLERESNLSEEKLREIGRAIGIGAMKYADLSKDRVSDYVFSWDKMLAMDGNTGPYLQYAHARICSILRKAAEMKKSGTSAHVSPGRINPAEPFELALAKQVLRIGEIIDIVRRELKPHLLCTYFYDLATKFSGFYENCPVIQSEEPVRSSRLELCRVTARTMALGLDLLGIDHPEQM